MKNCIITQAKDQSFRLKDWILYHKEEGFDTIIYFDDYSEDNSVEVMKNISSKYNINIIINYSDNIGNRKTKQEMTNSNSYGGDISINNRLIRSYNTGLKIARGLNTDSICAIIDVDEFLVSNCDKKVVDVISDMMIEKKTLNIFILTLLIDSAYFDKMNVDNYDPLRIHHYRNPCMDKSFKFVEDRKLLDKMIKIKEKYEV